MSLCALNGGGITYFGNSDFDCEINELELISVKEYCPRLDEDLLISRVLILTKGPASIASSAWIQKNTCHGRQSWRMAWNSLNVEWKRQIIKKREKREIRDAGEVDDLRGWIRGEDESGPAPWDFEPVRNNRPLRTAQLLNGGNTKF